MFNNTSQFLNTNIKGTLPWIAALLFPLSVIASSPAPIAAEKVFVPRHQMNGIAQLIVIDRTENKTLQVHKHHSGLYVAAKPGHEFSLQVVNKTGERILAVVSVDGINVINGERASYNQTGYVLSPYDGVKINGWRKSMNDVAKFYFTNPADSYSAHSKAGSPRNLGIIGAAIFKEKVYAPMPKDGLSLENHSGPTHPSAAARSKSELGTGHGQREYNPATRTTFERATPTPQEVLVINYDTYQNLVARGIIVDGCPPSAFREFVPDPDCR